MQFGLIISVLMHVAILGGALISIQSRAELRLPETEPVAVGMISPGEVTKVRQGVRTAKLLEAEPKESPKGDLAKKEAVKPKLAAAAPPPPPPPPAAPEEKAEPPAPKVIEPPPPAPAAAEAQKKLEAEQQKLAEQQKKAEEQRLAEEKQRAEQQKQADEKRLAEEKQRAEAQEKAEAMKRAEEQKLAEERKIAEEQRLADERKRAEEEQRRLEEQRKQAELKKKRDDEKKRREAELKKKKAAEKKKREEEEKKQQEAEAAKAKNFDGDKIAALLNKVPDKAAPPPPSAADHPTKAKGPTLGAPDGKDKQLSVSERGMILQIIKSCVQARWTVLSGGASAQETVVKIRLRFNADGTLSAAPELRPPQGTPTPYFRAISESALRAVQECEPYNLPPDLYDHWKDILMSFSPKDMY